MKALANISRLSAAFLLTLAFLFCSSCVSIPDGVEAVKPFDVSRYLGKWYEIARLDFKHERDLNNVTATYSLNEDKTIKVLNRGFNYVEKEWKQSTGKAKPYDHPQEGRLKVSFFGPFYSGYNVVALDQEYKYALVMGDDLDNMWLLSRDKTMPEEVKQRYLTIAKNAGYKTEDLVWPEHDKD